MPAPPQRPISGVLDGGNRRVHPGLARLSSSLDEPTFFSFVRVADHLEVSGGHAVVVDPSWSPANKRLARLCLKRAILPEGTSLFRAQGVTLLPPPRWSTFAYYIRRTDATSGRTTPSTGPDPCRPTHPPPAMTTRPPAGAGAKAHASHPIPYVWRRELPPQLVRCGQWAAPQ